MVLADPEGNEFCVIEPGNGFLADCGLVGALACDGSQQVGFLEPSAGLAAGVGPGPGDGDPLSARRSQDHMGWPAADAEDRQEPVAPRRRVADAGRPAGRGRPLVTLGATCLHDVRGESGRTAMTDPDGNEFCLL